MYNGHMMMKSVRDRARQGDIGCPCCRCPQPARTYRTRENRAWRKDAVASE